MLWRSLELSKDDGLPDSLLITEEMAPNNIPVFGLQTKLHSPGAIIGFCSEKEDSAKCDLKTDIAESTGQH